MQVTNNLNNPSLDNSIFSLEQMPNEIHSKIFDNFSVEEASDYRTVSKKWSDLGKNRLELRTQNLLRLINLINDIPETQLSQHIIQIFDPKNASLLNRIFLDKQNYHMDLSFFEEKKISPGEENKTIPAGEKNKNISTFETGLDLKVNKFFTTYPLKPRKDLTSQFNKWFFLLYNLFKGPVVKNTELAMTCYLEFASTYPTQWTEHVFELNGLTVDLKTLTGLRNREMIPPYVLPWLIDLKKWEINSAIKTLPLILSVEAYSDLVTLLYQIDRFELVMQMFDYLLLPSSHQMYYFDKVIYEQMNSNLFFESLVSGFLKKSQTQKTFKMALNFLTEISKFHINANKLFFDKLNKRTKKETFTSKLKQTEKDTFTSKLEQTEKDTFTSKLEQTEKDTFTSNLEQFVKDVAASSSVDALLIIRFYSTYYKEVEKFNPYLTEFINLQMPTLLRSAFENLNKFQGMSSDFFVPEPHVPPRFQLLKYGPQLNQKEVFWELFKNDIVEPGELMCLLGSCPKYWPLVANLTAIDVEKHREILFFYKNLIDRAHFQKSDVLESINENLMNFGLFPDPSLNFSDYYGGALLIKLNRLLDLMIENLKQDSAYREQTKRIVIEHGYGVLENESVVTALRVSMREEELDQEQQRMQKDFALFEAAKSNGASQPSFDYDDDLQYPTDDEIIPSDDEDMIQSDVDDSAE